MNKEDMQNDELEGKVIIMEELLQSLSERTESIESTVSQELALFSHCYRETLNEITARIETANNRYDSGKIKQQIDLLIKLVDTAPKSVTVKNHHHFGAWSKTLVITIAATFFIMTGSVAVVLHLNESNGKLETAAYRYDLVKAFYPDLASELEKRLAADPDGIVKAAEQAVIKRQAILNAEPESRQADEAQKAARRKLQKVKTER